MTLKTILEALVFGSPKPITVKEMLAALSTAGDLTATDEARALGATRESEVTASLEELKQEYAESGRGFRLVEQVNGWTLVTDPETSPWVKQLYPEAKPTRLSGPALETLAIVAYRQPVTRADVEAVRGVAVDGVMQVLLDRGLVKISGRADVPGRPLLYGTTEYFLQHFGLKTVDELPNSAELKRVVLPTAPIPEAEPEAPKKGKKSGKATPVESGSEVEAAPAPEAQPPEGTEEVRAEEPGETDDSVASESPEESTTVALDKDPASEINIEQP